MINVFAIINNLNDVEYYEENIHNSSITAYMFKNDINTAIKNLLVLNAVQAGNEIGLFDIKIKAEQEFEKLKWLEEKKLYMYKGAQQTYFFLLQTDVKKHALINVCRRLYNLELKREDIFSNFATIIAEDKISLIQDKLAETKEILIKDIIMVLDRGEKLDKLIEASNKLKEKSIVFTRTSKKLNSCC